MIQSQGYPTPLNLLQPYFFPLHVWRWFDIIWVFLGIPYNPTIAIPITNNWNPILNNSYNTDTIPSKTYRTLDWLFTHKCNFKSDMNPESFFCCEIEQLTFPENVLSWIWSHRNIHSASGAELGEPHRGEIGGDEVPQPASGGDPEPVGSRGPQKTSGMGFARACWESVYELLWVITSLLDIQLSRFSVFLIAWMVRDHSTKPWIENQLVIKNDVLSMHPPFIKVRGGDGPCFKILEFLGLWIWHVACQQVKFWMR